MRNQGESAAKLGITKGDEGESKMSIMKSSGYSIAIAKF